ncbi:Serine carboxypeptidase-like 12, partial [Camellia lanceoleosa]
AAYHLALTSQLSWIHDVFHISMLCKYEPDPSHVLDWKNLEISDGYRRYTLRLKITGSIESVFVVVWKWFQGYILGNPVTTLDDGNYAIPFAHGMGLISDELYEINALKLSHLWLNDDRVREALHIQKGSIGEWNRCTNGLPYTQSIWDSFQYHVNLSTKGYKFLIYR